MDDDQLSALAASIDPSVPFRARRSHVHRTWAGTFTSRPELLLSPQSIPEVQKLVRMARRARRRVVVVGSGHSPSELTCTSAWHVTLDGLSRVLSADTHTSHLKVEAGIRLRDIGTAALEHGLALPSMGSIDVQSIAGATATGTHGSSLVHGPLSSCIASLAVVLGTGEVVRCSATDKPELFRAALTSVGALGVVVQVELRLVRARNVAWEQTVVKLDDVLAGWERGFWSRKEFVRGLLLPYARRVVVWSADRSDEPLRATSPSPPWWRKTWYTPRVETAVYEALLWLSNYVPRILPAVEWFVYGMSVGFSTAPSLSPYSPSSFPSSSTVIRSGVLPPHTGLLMDCSLPQYVYEWALPLDRGREALVRLTDWITSAPGGGGIPFPISGLWVHSPIEVRVGDNSPTAISSRADAAAVRPYLDACAPDGPTLFLNATSYRPYGAEPTCHRRWLQAFEWLMRDLGGRPHWAKNAACLEHGFLSEAYETDLQAFVKVRDEADPDGVFLGSWHRRALLPPGTERYPCEESEIETRPAPGGGLLWVGDMGHGEAGELVDRKK